MKILKKNKLNLKLYPNPDYVFCEYIIVGVKDVMEVVEKSPLHQVRILCKLLYSQFLFHKDYGQWGEVKIVEQFKELKYYTDIVLS